MIRILSYVKRTPSQDMLYESRGHTEIVRYCDVDRPDSSIDRRSPLGYYVFNEGNLISWKSMK